MLESGDIREQEAQIRSESIYVCQPDMFDSKYDKYYTSRTNKTQVVWPEEE